MNIIDMFKNFKEDMNKSVNDSVGKKKFKRNESKNRITKENPN